VQDDMNITLMTTGHEKLPDLPRFHGITDGIDWPPATGPSRWEPVHGPASSWLSIVC
jgi:hypothetical protein